MSFMSLPVEIVLNIFHHLHANDLITCSGVCRVWYDIVQQLRENDEFWWKRCKENYKDLYQSVRIKSRRELTWFNIYKSLALWPKVATAKHNIIEFAKASSDHERINDFAILEDDTIGIYKRNAITYYNTNSLETTSKPSITGSYTDYAENKHIVSVLSMDKILYLTKKMLFHESEQSHIYFRDVKSYTINGNKAFYVKTNNAVYLCDMSALQLTESHLFTPEDAVTSLSYTKDKLYALSSDYKIIYYDNQMNKVVTEPTSLNYDLKVLYEHGFTKDLNWRMYNQWLFCNDSSMPLSVLEDASTVLGYGNIIAVATYFGIFYLYYFTDEIDFSNLKLLKRMNLRTGESSPILRIDIVEVMNGHKIFLATPQKMIVIELLHD